MIHTMLAVSAPLLILVLAVPRATKARRMARLLRSQQKWAETMDRHTQPRRQGPWRAATPAVVKRSSGESSNPPVTPAKSA